MTFRWTSTLFPVRACIVYTRGLVASAPQTVTAPSSINNKDTGHHPTKITNYNDEPISLSASNRALNKLLSKQPGMHRNTSFSSLYPAGWVGVGFHVNLLPAFPLWCGLILRWNQLCWLPDVRSRKCRDVHADNAYSSTSSAPPVQLHVKHKCLISQSHGVTQSIKSCRHVGPLSTNMV